MKNLKKITALGLSAAMVMSMVPATLASADEETGKVYYLNFKPEQATQWEDLAAKYTDETGVQVDVVTAASGTYESTLKSEMAKAEAPTLFQVNGPVGLATWKDYCYDLKDSEVYKHLKSDDFALKNDDGSVQGIAYVIETYGLIYNKKLLNDYMATDGAVISSVDELNNFETLKAVADDIQAKKDDLGIEGAFASTGFDSSSDWRFKTHLANLPIYYEYKADGINSTDAIKGTYLDNYKQIFDLYITDSTCEPTVLSSKTGEDAASEFALGEAVFYQNGDWEYANFADDNENGYTVKQSDLSMMPIYFGVDDENEGLAVGTENHWTVNAKADQKDIDATLEFLNWVITSDDGRDAIVNKMGLSAPFDTFTGDYESKNAFANVASELAKNGKTSVAWSFNATPSVDDWRADFLAPLTEYTERNGSWDDVTKAFSEKWAYYWDLQNEQ